LHHASEDERIGHLEAIRKRSKYTMMMTLEALSNEEVQNAIGVLWTKYCSEIDITVSRQ